MKVFISATSADLQKCRTVVNDALQKGDIQPVDQEHFPPDHRPLNDYLEATVGDCHAVVCLVGHVFGAAPADGPRPPRSYTQLEYDYARSRDKPVFVFLASEKMRSAEGSEPPELQRLQQEHRRRVQKDHTWETFETPEQLELLLAHAVRKIRAACGRVPMYYRHVPKPPAWFKGRMEECAQLREALAPSKPGIPRQGVVVVCGIGGQGKTTLVHQVLRQKLDLTLDSGFWATAHRTGYTFDAFLDDALEHLTNGSFDKQGKAHREARVAELLRIMQWNRTLVVIDGLEAWLQGGGRLTDRQSLQQARRAQLAEVDLLLEQASGLNNDSHLIVTSRVFPSVLDHTDVATIPVRDRREKRLGLDGLDEEAAVALMRSLGVEGDDAELAVLAQKFQHHPLALQVVSGYIVMDYGGRLREVPSLEDVSPEDGLARLFSEVESRLPAREESRRLLQIISLSQQESSISVNALAHVLAGDGPAGVRAVERLNRLLSTLAQYQLLSFDARDRVVYVHPLVKQYFAATVPQEDSRGLHQRYCGYYAGLPLPEQATALDEVRSRLLAIEHALLAGAIDRCAELLTSKLTPRHTFVEWLGEHGHFSEGADILRRAAESDSATHRYRFLIPRAALCLPVGWIEEAIVDLDEAVDSLADSQAHPESSPARAAELAAALSNRGIAHLRLARYDAARADFNRSVNLFEQLAHIEGRHWFHAAAARSNRGMLLRELGHLSDAIEDYTAAVKIYHSRLEPGLNRINNDLAAAFCNRGNVYSDLRLLDKAHRDYVQARDIYQMLLNNGRTEYRAPLARSDVLLATVLQKQGQHTRALALFDQSIATLRDLIDADKAHFEPSLAFSQMCRALSSTELGRHEEALHDSGQARDTYNRLVGEGREDLEGQWVHALLVHWYCLVGASGAKSAESQYLAATLAAGRLISQGEKDVRMILIRYTLDSGWKEFENRGEKAVELINKGLQMAEQALSEWTLREWTFGVEAVKAELQFWFSKQPFIDAFEESSGPDKELLERIRDFAF